MAHVGYYQLEPTPNRGLDLLDVAQLRNHRSRYVAYQDRLDHEQHVWPPPDCALSYVASVLAEIEQILAQRDTTPEAA